MIFLRFFSKNLKEQSRNYDKECTNMLYDEIYASLPDKSKKLDFGWRQFHKLKYKELTLRSRCPDNCVYIMGKIYVIRNILKSPESSYFLEVSEFVSQTEFYNIGISSINVGIFFVLN